MTLAFWSSDAQHLKGIKLFYNLLQDKGKFIKEAALKRWEQDLKVSFSDSQWTKAIHYNHSSSKCINYCELSQKLHHSWFLTPVQMHKFANIDDDKCWRGCSQTGSLPHIVWKCPHIHTFWNKVFTLIF